MYYAFDVDGTLTPSREKISPEFGAWFLEWIRSVQARGDIVLLATGSDRPKTEEQLGEEIFNSIAYACNCMGNMVYHYGKLIHEHKFIFPHELLITLHDELVNSPYKDRAGNHIEDRGAMFNFSIVGRDATPEQRKRYHDWDQHSGERLAIAARINDEFAEHDIVAQVAGEIGMDITNKGRDKRQCIKYMQDSPVMFFGDRMDEQGNDRPLADEIQKLNNGGKCFEVTNWQETWELLKSFK
jgi:phosphomannomutase